MKKIFTLMLCAFVIATVTSCGSSLSEQEKEVKAKVKELKKEGWKVVGDEDLTTVVSRHMEKIYASRKDTSSLEKRVSVLSEFTGDGEGCNNIESGKIAARNDAPIIFAESVANLYPELHEKFATDFAKRLAEELTPSFYLYKKIDEEGYHVRGFFLLSMKECLVVEEEVLNAIRTEIKSDTILQDANQ